MPKPAYPTLLGKLRLAMRESGAVDALESLDAALITLTRAYEQLLYLSQAGVDPDFLGQCEEELFEAVDRLAEESEEIQGRLQEAEATE